MGYALLGIAALVFLSGVGAQLAFLAFFGPGAGDAGLADNVAVQSAQAVALYASACADAAAANPGLIASGLTVVLSSGGASIAAPSSANCMTTAAPGGGRYVFASAKFQPGMGGYLMDSTQGSALWYRVNTAGQAVSLSSGATVAVSAAIPAGSILNWSQVAN